MRVIYPAAQDHLYDVLLKTVNTGKGKELVRKHIGDGQAALGALFDYYFGESSHASTEADRLHREITTFTIPQRHKRDQPDEEYLRQFWEKIYNY